MASRAEEEDAGAQKTTFAKRMDELYEKLVAHPKVSPDFKGQFMHGMMLAPLALRSDVAASSREELLAIRMRDGKLLAEMQGEAGPIDFESLFTEEVRAAAAEDKVEVTETTITSQPDGNTVPVCVIRPKREGADGGPLPCVMYTHGGGMAIGSAFNPEYKTFGKLMAVHGVVVVLPEFRNSQVPTAKNQDIAPYPGGLNDCYSMLQWIHDNKAELGVDGRVVVAGESGGGNLCLAVALKATREGRADLVRQGIYSLCPYIVGQWPQDTTDTETLGRSHLDSENNNLFIDLTGNEIVALGYGIDAFRAKDALAWPAFATDEDLKAFPNGARVTCKQIMGSIHGSSIFGQFLAPEIAFDAAAAITAMAKSAPPS